MRPTPYTVDHPGPGQLSTMAKPRGADWLDDEMTGLRAIGADILACALTSSELTESGLEAEAEAARSAGLRFIHIPIPDRDVPDLATVLPTLTQLTERLRGGTHVVCRFGIGPASLLAAALLILDGVTPATAWQQLEQARGLTVPDTTEQQLWPNKLVREGP
jgi:hypothetical protein